MTVSDVFFAPNGEVSAYTAPVKQKKGKQRGQVVQRSIVVPMLSGAYSAVKFKLIPAINSCSPELHGTKKAIGLLERDTRRFCVVRRKPTQKELDEDTDRATEAAQQVVPS